jgi:hypothetical protein
MSSRISLRPESIPFPIPGPLQKVLLDYQLETGAGGGVGIELPATKVWTLLDSAGISVGQGWINTQTGPRGETRSFVNLAVYEGERSKGAAREGLRQIEAALKSGGHTELFAQVNSNREKTGARVRKWLVAEGYILLREDISPRRKDWTDSEIIKGDPCALKFVKTL